MFSLRLSGHVLACVADKHVIDERDRDRFSPSAAPIRSTSAAARVSHLKDDRPGDFEQVPGRAAAHDAATSSTRRRIRALFTKTFALGPRRRAVTRC